jgi:hypothetical protein
MQQGLLLSLRSISWCMHEVGYLPSNCYVTQSHKTNLAVETLSVLPVVSLIEDLLQDVYTFFCKSPKKHLAFVKLAEMMDTKGNKILR